MAWFCDLVQFIVLLLGFSHNLCGVNDVASLCQPSVPLLPSPGSAHLLLPELPTPVKQLDEVVATTEQPHVPSTTVITSTSTIDTDTSTDVLAPRGRLPLSGDDLPDIKLDNTPAASSTNPVEALGSDLINTTQSKAIKMKDITAISKFIQALQKLKVEKIGDGYDQRTQDLIQHNFGLKNKAKYYNTTQLIRHCRHRVEEFTVKTSDGYFLKLYRIRGRGSPVLLMHGLLSCSDDWLTLGCEKSLPYMVSKAGHDVWLGNVRGDKYSQRHETFNPDTDMEFWDFSWHEIGVTDLPNIIDFILLYTDRPKLSYIGHSQGTTSAFVLLSERPEYNDKMHLMVALSPVAWMGETYNPLLQVLSQFTDDMELLMRVIGMGQYALSDEYAAAVRTVICGTSATAAAVCDPVLAGMYGFSPEYKNFEYLPVQTSHILTSSASKQVIHYMQEMRSGKFQQFDYGVDKNQAIYGSDEPPEYPVESITVPTALFYSTNDWQAAVSDVLRLQKRLPNVVYSEQLEVQYSHIDFLWAHNADQSIYFTVLNLLGEYAR